MVLSVSEKQIVIALQNLILRKMTTSIKDLESFGESFFCSYKKEWKESIKKLIDKKIVIEKDDQLSINHDFDQYANWLVDKYPRFLYWYNDWYRFGETSKSHGAICEKAFGINLCQTGMVTKKQIDYMINNIIQDNKRCLDLGCGSGRIIEYVSDSKSIIGIGIDVVANGIRYALQRTKDKRERLHYYQRSMLEIQSLNQRFDYILAFDTFYFVQENVEQILDDCFEVLNDKGKLLVLYSAWNPKDKSLDPNHTFLGELLNKKQLNYQFIDFTEDERKHWILKEEAILHLKENIIQEGSMQVFEKLYNEANYFANLSKEKAIVRYLYIIGKDEENDKITIS